MSGAIFLSYASQDSAAARRICEALRSGGVEVWFDQEGGLEHGDAWDVKIRRQIRECILFIPLVSANTQARHEGYFRIEWDLAAERAQGIAQGVPFILPVVIDDTRQSDALVPDRFLQVQWTRLSDGVVPPEVLARLLKLWSHRTVSPSQREAQSEAPGSRNPGWQPAGVIRRSGAKAYASIALAILVLAGAAGWWVLRGTKGSQAPQASPARAEALPTASAVSVPPVSQARQLAAQARAMSIDAYASNPDDFAAADGLVKHALELDPNDAEVWAISSILNRSYSMRGFDYSPERVSEARSQAERAVRIDPHCIDALYALGFAERTGDPSSAEAIFKKVLVADPNYWDAMWNLSSLYSRQNRIADALAILDRGMAMPQHAALAGYLEFLIYFSKDRFSEADHAIRASIAAQPSANSVAGLAMLLVTWKGDADGAARALADGPASQREEHRTIWCTVWVQLQRRAPDEALAALARMSDTFIQDSWFFGPKAYFVGRAEALANRPEAARVAWEAALAETRSALAEHPDDPQLHLIQGEILALLGQNDEALKEARTTEEMENGRHRDWFFSPVRIYAALGRADEAVPELRALLNKERSMSGWPLTRALLRTDPLWDKLRADPKFAALLSESQVPAAKL